MTEVKDQEHEEQDITIVAIADIVQELGELGLIPYEFSTGIGSQSIVDDTLWKPSFGIEINMESEAHYIFTISAMAGWTAEYDIQGRGILLKQSVSGRDETIGAWALLLNATRLVMGEIRNT